MKQNEVFALCLLNLLKYLIANKNIAKISK
jgi:hypothetical protein